MVLIFQMSTVKKLFRVWEFRRGKLDKLILFIRQCFAHLREVFIIPVAKPILGAVFF